MLTLSLPIGEVNLEWRGIGYPTWLEKGNSYNIFIH